jgi:hypothetical protein
MPQTLNQGRQAFEPFPDIVLCEPIGNPARGLLLPRDILCVWYRTPFVCRVNLITANLAVKPVEMFMLCLKDYSAIIASPA